MKKYLIISIISLVAVFALSTKMVLAETITTGPSSAETNIYNDVNHNTEHCYCSPTPTYDPGTPTPTPTVSVTPTPTTPPIGGGNPGGGGNGGGNGGPSSCTAPTPGTVHLISVDPMGTGKVKLIWTTAQSADNYSILYGVGSNNYTNGVASTGNVWNYEISSLDPGQNYCFVIVPKNGCAAAGRSNEVCTKKVVMLPNTGSENMLLDFVTGLTSVVSGIALFVYHGKKSL